MAYYLDKNMVTASLCPLADTQLACVTWLGDHFSLYGDQAPNRDETHLVIMHKKDIYEKYVNDMKKTQQDYSSLSTFIELWNSLYPTCLSRPWVDIPGKCSTCCYIDQSRRTSVGSNVHIHLKQAFSLHRGGLFMLERLE